MKILVTGSGGFIGSRLCKKLDDYIGIDRKDGKELLNCELPDDIDLIYHLAAQTSVEDSWTDPLKDSYNFNTTVRIANHYPNARIIYASSAATLSPSSPYGFSKKISAEYLKKFHNNFVICIFSNIFGGGKGVADAFRNSKKVTIYGDGLQKRDFVHVDDIVEALLKAQKWPTGEYLLGSENGITIKELAQGKEIVYEKARNEIRESIVANTTPDWKPKIDVLEYISNRT